jgi:hypothetical protein
LKFYFSPFCFPKISLRVLDKAPTCCPNTDKENADLQP